MSNRRKRESFLDKSWVQAVLNFFKKIAIVLGLTTKYAYKVRSLMLAIPVFICAGALAIRNARLLPEYVGVNLLASGEYQHMVSRGIAVWTPLGLTVLCLLLMLCSKKVMYPWLISVFSLVLPLVILLTNSFTN
jgi:hypothetical protein